LQTRTAFTDYLPEKSDVTQAYETVQNDYPALVAPSIVVVADTTPDEAKDLYDHLSGLADVGYVTAPTALSDDANRSVINVHVDIENQVGQQVTDDVIELRGHDPGYGIQIGGPAALQYDFMHSIIDRAPLALAIMIVAVFLLLFLMTGSLMVPLKAIIINALSLFASLGVTTFIFMNGLVGMPKVMGMETFILVCTACFGFGLAMDYEVFLISRIKEFWDKGLPNDEAVERGLQRSGRIITSAAAIIVAVFIGFTFGEMIPIKEIGVALAATVVIDATLVRMLLVPATMTVLGKYNWWAPKPFRWLYSKLHIVH
jgi:RND superfamily putative drug exporter